MSIIRGGAIVNDLSANEQLDGVLNVLYVERKILSINAIILAMKDEPTFKIQHAHGQDDSPFHIQSIVNHLKDDKYVELDGVDDYRISFKGIVFKENGGYVTNQISLEYKMRLKILKTNLLVFGSIGAAIGSLMLTFVEILKYKKWALSIELWSHFFLFASGALLGVCIVLIIKQIVNQK